MNKVIKDFIDRVGWTAIQAFIGVMTATQITGLGDLKSAAISAGTAALVAVVKVIGVSASSAASDLQNATPDQIDGVLQTLAAKLRTPKQ